MEPNISSTQAPQAPVPIKGIVGLGNPGIEYIHTRHNIGFRIIDAWAQELGSQWASEVRFKAHIASAQYAGQKLKLIKPMTFMNLSGESVGKLARFYGWQPANMAVIYDDITLECGRFKVSMAGSAGGHNGIKSLLAHVGDGFVRLRIGVGGKTHPSIDLADHVLSPFSKEHEGLIESRMQEFLKALKLLIDKGPIMTMNLVNQIGKSND